MTHLPTTKALIPYVSPNGASKKSGFYSLFQFRKAIDFYNSRASYYYELLITFAIISVFTRCIHIKAQAVSFSFINEMGAEFTKAGFTIEFVFSYLSPLLFCCFCAFLAGFTVFAQPLSLISFLHFSYRSSYVFFACIDKAYNLNFLSCFCYIALFALLMVVSIVFFAEASTFYRNTDKLQKDNNRTAPYIALFILYSSVCLAVSYLSLHLLFCS